MLENRNKFFDEFQSLMIKKIDKINDDPRIQLIKIVSTIACHENKLTPLKFQLVMEFMRQLSQSDHDWHILNITSLHYLKEPLSLSKALSELKKLSKNLTSEKIEIINSLFISLIDDLSAKSELQAKIEKALMIEEENKSSFVLFDKLTETFFSASEENFKLPDEYYEHLKKSLDQFEKENINHGTDIIVTSYKEAIKSIHQLLAHQKKQIIEQIEMDKIFINEEFEDVISDIIISSEKAMLGRIATSDITRSDIWNKFGKEQTSLIIDLRWSKCEKRIYSILNKRINDIDFFIKEIDENKSSIDEAVLNKISTDIVPDTSFFFQIKGQLDHAFDNIFRTAQTGGAIAGIGVLSGVVKASTLAALFSTPIGLGLLGITGVTALYKLAVRPQSRVNMQLTELSSKLEKQLTNKLDAKFKKIEKEFSQMVNKLELTEKISREYLETHYQHILYYDLFCEIKNLVMQNGQNIYMHR